MARSFLTSASCALCWMLSPDALIEELEMLETGGSKKPLRSTLLSKVKYNFVLAIMRVYGIMLAVQ